MNRDQFKALYHAARYASRNGYYPLPNIDGVSIHRGAVRRVGPNGRAYCALTIDRALHRAKTSLNVSKGIAFEKGALQHVRGARSWDSWAVLP